MLHIVAVQFSLHKQQEEQAARKGKAGQTDRGDITISPRQAIPTMLSLILKITSFLKWKPVCDVHAEFTLLSYLAL